MSAMQGVGAPGAGDEVPRVVTTGRKSFSSTSTVDMVRRIDQETGEPVEVYPLGKGCKVVRRLVADEHASPGTALVDALSFTVLPPDDHSFSWLVSEMRCFVPGFEVKHRSSGGAGFKYSADLCDGVGLVRWGGESQYGRVLFSMMGKGCSLVSDWAGLAAWLEKHRARITRADVAHDDFKGRVVSIEWAVEQYRVGGFTAGGRAPRHEVFGDWLDGAASRLGRTLGIGNRSSGKYCRIYEKGKQLGDQASPWVRVEVEWHHQDRVIPFDVLTRPGQYLAGAYPCLRMLSNEQDRIRTVAKGAVVSFDKAVENGKQQAGKLVHLMLRVYGGNYAEVVERLQREGVPSRIAPYSYHVDQAPELLDEDMPGSFAELLDGGDGRTDGRAAAARPAGAAAQRPIR